MSLNENPLLNHVNSGTQAGNARVRSTVITSGHNLGGSIYTTAISGGNRYGTTTQNTVLGSNPFVTHVGQAPGSRANPTGGSAFQLGYQRTPMSTAAAHGPNQGHAAVTVPTTTALERSLPQFRLAMFDGNPLE